MYMDFARSVVSSQGFGHYTRLASPSNFPCFFIAYLNTASESGKIHSNVKQRFEQGDPVSEEVSH